MLVPRLRNKHKHGKYAFSHAEITSRFSEVTVVLQVTVTTRCSCAWDGKHSSKPLQRLNIEPIRVDTSASRAFTELQIRVEGIHGLGC